MENRIITNGYIDNIESHILKSSTTRNLDLYHSLRPKKAPNCTLSVPSKAFLNKDKDSLESECKNIKIDTVDVVFLINKSLKGERFISTRCPIHTYKPMVVEQVKDTAYWKIGCYFEGCKYFTDDIPFRFFSERETIIAWNLHILKNIEYLPKDFQKFVRILKYLCNDEQINRIFSYDDKICYDDTSIKTIQYYCDRTINIIKLLLSYNNTERLILSCPNCGKEPKIVEDNNKIGCCNFSTQFPISEYATLAWNVLILNNV